MLKSKRVLIVLTLFIVLGFNGCVGGSFIANDVTWKNKEIQCGLIGSERPIRQFPFQKGIPDAQRIDPEGMTDFCTSMQNHFSESGMSSGEAEKVYKAILKAGIIKSGGSYGMPGSKMSKSKEMTTEDLYERVIIKKTGKNKYEMFYKYYGCGSNYSYQKFKLLFDKITDKEEIESWSGSSPC